MEENILRITDFKKRYKNFTLDIPLLEVKRGCITGLIGRNGAGKTTLIRAAAGMSGFEGDIEILGMHLPRDAKRVKTHIGAALTKGVLISELSLEGTEKAIAPFYPAWDSQAYRRYAERFGLDMKRKLKTFSDGMLAKAALTVALSHRAELIILDEPSAGLDPMAREDLMKALTEAMNDDTAVIVSTHITSDLDRVADRIVMLDGGRVVIDDEKDALLESHCVIRGGAEELAGVKEKLIAYTENAYSFEGLIKRRELASVTGDFRIEKPSVEMIMKMYSKAREACKNA